VRERDREGRAGSVDRPPGRGGRGAWIPAIAVAVVAVVAVAVVSFGSGDEVDPLSAAIGGRLLYTVPEDDPAFHRMWVVDLATGEAARGPRLPAPIHLVHAPDIGPDAVASVSASAAGESADLLRFLGPDDEAISVLQGEVVAWAPRGEVALAAATLDGCSAVEVTVWFERSGQARTDTRDCAQIGGIIGTDLTAYLTTATDGPPLIEQVAPLGITPVVSGYLPVAASGRGLYLVEATSLNDANIGPALYASVASPTRREIVPVGALGDRFTFEAYLSEGIGPLGDLLLGTYQGRRGIFRMVIATEGLAVRPTLVLETVAGDVVATSADDGSVIASIGDRLVAVRDGGVADLVLPDGAPPVDGQVLWIPDAEPAEATPS
jgi:hypothetical protein